MDPTALLIQNMFPAPNNASPVFNYTVPGYSDYRHTTIPSIKIDELISSKLKLSAYYSATKTLLAPDQRFRRQPSYRFDTVQDALAQTVRVNLDDTVTPTLLLHFGAGLLHTTNPSVNPTLRSGRSRCSRMALRSLGKYFPYLSGLDASGFLFRPASAAAAHSRHPPIRPRSLKHPSRRISSRPLTPARPGSRETIPSSWARLPCLRASPASQQPREWRI